jgi:hypothetical protein
VPSGVEYVQVRVSGGANDGADELSLPLGSLSTSGHALPIGLISQTNSRPSRKIATPALIAQVLIAG